MLKKGNWGLLLVALAAIVAMIATSLGGHVYRWEFITWLAVCASNSVIGYFYSRSHEGH